MKKINQLLMPLFAVAASSVAVVGVVAETTKIKADNSKINQRDRAQHELTADAQHSKREDIDLTRRIRKDIIADKTLSTYATNIKVITQLGKVTLKGPVRSEIEQEKIVSIAQHIAGPLNVKNETDIVSKESK